MEDTLKQLHVLSIQGERERIRKELDRLYGELERLEHEEGYVKYRHMSVGSVFLHSDHCHYKVDGYWSEGVMASMCKEDGTLLSHSKRVKL